MCSKKEQGYDSVPSMSHVQYGYGTPKKVSMLSRIGCTHIVHNKETIKHVYKAANNPQCHSLVLHFLHILAYKKPDAGPICSICTQIQNNAVTCTNQTFP